MPSEARQSPPDGLLATLRAGWVAGLQVGVLAGLVDGLACAMGLDSEFFLIHAKLEGLAAALPGLGAALGGIGANIGPILASAFAYALVASLAGAACGLGAHLFLRSRSLERRQRLLWGLALGLWLGFASWWWTRPVVLAGYSSVHPLRLAALAAICAGGIAAGLVLERLTRGSSRAVRRVARRGAWICALAGGLVLATDWPRAGQRGLVNERTRDLPNVLIIIVDALRSDVLSCYGSTEVETPVIDALAARGVLFERAFVQAPFTWSSFGSILTGKYPRRHGLVKMAPGVRMAPNVTFPFYLQGARRSDGVRLEEGDYVGAAFMTGTLSHGSGLLRGFDYYCEALVGHDLVDLHSRWSSFRSGLLPWLFWSKLQQRLDPQRVASTAVDWFHENRERRFVSMVHYYSTHTPYAPHEPWRSQYVDPDYQGPFETFEAYHREAIEDGKYTPTDADRERIRDLYHAGAAEADAMIGRVLDALEAEGTLDNTLVVVTSDHGEELGEHGVWEHNFMYQTNLSIPLVMAWPGHLPAGERVSALVETVDIVPTLCALMGLEPPAESALTARDKESEREWIDGFDLRPLIEGRTSKVRDYSFAENGRYRSIQSLDEKLIVRRHLLDEDAPWEQSLNGAGSDPSVEAPRYFDLRADPGETSEALGEHRQAAGALFQELKKWSDRMPIGDHLLRESARDLRSEEVLGHLGYAGGIGEGEEDE